jgi:iron(III) transport system substrate-binding protein
MLHIRKKLHRSKLVMLTVLLGLVLGACGAGDTASDTTEAESEATTTEAAAETTTTEAGAETTAGDDATETTAGGSDADWAAVEEAAREEGEVLFYFPTYDYIGENEVAAFNEVYPEITVTALRIQSDEMLPRFTAEMEANAASADLIKVGDTALMVTNPDFFVPISTDNIPNMEAANPEFTDDLYVGITGGPFVWTYNTELVPDGPPTDICTLPEFIEANPQVQGKVRLAIPGPGGGWGSWAIVRETCGDEWLETIGQLRSEGVLEFYESISTTIQEVGAGAAAMNAWGQPAHSLELRDAGAPVDYAYIENPSWGVTHYLGVSSGAANPNAALVLANFLLSREGNEASCSGVYVSMLYDDIPDCPMIPEDLQVEDTERGLAEGEEIDDLLQFVPEEG